MLWCLWWKKCMMLLIMLGWDYISNCRGGKKTYLVFTSLLSLLSLWDINTHKHIYVHVMCTHSHTRDQTQKQFGLYWLLDTHFLARFNGTRLEIKLCRVKKEKNLCRKCCAAQIFVVMLQICDIFGDKIYSKLIWNAKKKVDCSNRNIYVYF